MSGLRATTTRRWRSAAWLHADTREKLVVDAGGYHYLTLVRFEELPCIGNRLPVIADVIEEIEHDLVDARASQQGAVDRPIVGVDQRRVARPGDELLRMASGVSLDRTASRCAGDPSFQYSSSVAQIGPLIGSPNVGVF
jgi:hypothetical protein